MKNLSKIVIKTEGEANSIISKKQHKMQKYNLTILVVNIF